MKLLIVDDEDSFRQHLCHLFERRGFTAVAAKTGQETLEIAKRENFDIVLLDIVLPDIDGIEILKNLKRIYQDTQIIMMTGNATIENAIASMKLGAYDYLIKPFDLEELIILVERAGELTQLKRESEIFKRELD
ncbi:MAG: response regulator, partial [Calditrichia bacterium]